MRFLRFLFNALVFVLLIAALAYPAADLLRAPLDDAARADLLRSGEAQQFVHTADGYTHVRVQGPTDAPVVVLIHGYSGASFVFHDWMGKLSDAGFRVIAIDRFGNGFSDRPDVPYTSELYSRQIIDVLDALGVKGPVHIVGYSLGGAIVTALAAKDASRLKSVTLVAPAGLDGQYWPVEGVLAKPVIGDWFARVLGVPLLKYAQKKAYAEAPDPAAMENWFAGQTRYRGFPEGQLNTLRHYELPKRVADYDMLGRSGLPVLAVWGTGDTTVPFSQSADLLRRVPQTQLVSLEGKEHSITYAQADTVLTAVIPFLKSSGQ